MGGRARYQAGALAAAFTTVGAITAAQIAEEDGGVQAIVGVDLRIELDNGDPEFRTGFDLDLISATRTQRLSFSGDIGVRVPLDDFGGAEVDDPRFGLDYLRDTGRTRLTFSADYVRQDIDDISFPTTDDGFEEGDLTIIDGGVRERRQAAFGLELGVTDPIGATFNYSLDDQDYIDTTDPDLDDTRTEQYSVGLRLDVDRTLRFTIDAGYRMRETGGTLPEVDTRTTLAFGGRWQALPNLLLDGSIAYAKTESEVSPGTVNLVSSKDGVNVVFGATFQQSATSRLRFDLSRILNQAGYVTTAEISATYNLPQDATLNTMIGATRLPSGEVYPVWSLSYDRDTRLGDLTGALRRSATVNGDDEEVVRSTLEGGYRMALPQDARIGFTGRLTESEFVDGTQGDVSTASVSVNYNRPLTEDWDFATGVRWQRTEEDGVGSDSDNSLFLSLERRFSFRR